MPTTPNKGGQPAFGQQPAYAGGNNYGNYNSPPGTGYPQGIGGTANYNAANNYGIGYPSSSGGYSNINGTQGYNNSQALANAASANTPMGGISSATRLGTIPGPAGGGGGGGGGNGGDNGPLTGQHGGGPGADTGGPDKTQPATTSNADWRWGMQPTNPLQQGVNDRINRQITAQQAMMAQINANRAAQGLPPLGTMGFGQPTPTPTKY